MRQSIAIIVIAVTSLTALASREETVQALMARAEVARPEDRPALYVEIAERQLKTTDEFYAGGNLDAAAAALKDVVTYSEKAHDSALQSGKRLKGTEIALRKMSARLRDIKRTLNFEDQSPVQAAADRIENLRTDLLTKMFGKNK